MNIKLNSWQTIALFLPLIISWLIMGIPHQTFTGYQEIMATANFLVLVNIFIVILYQTHLVLGFNYISGIRSTIFKINAVIPMVFITFYLLYVAYLTFLQSTHHSLKYNNGPIEKTSFTGHSWIIILFLIHAFTTFYFINNLFITNRIKKISDAGQQQKLRSEFLIPMKRLTKISICVVVILLVLTTIMDVFRYSITT